MTFAPAVVEKNINTATVKKHKTVSKYCKAISVK
jgi:hypothetical protein